MLKLAVHGDCTIFTLRKAADCLSLFGSACCMHSRPSLFFGEFAFHEYSCIDSNGWPPIMNSFSFESVRANITPMWHKSMWCKQRYMHYLALKWHVSFREHCTCHNMDGIHLQEGWSDAATAQSLLRTITNLSKISVLFIYPAEVQCKYSVMYNLMHPVLTLNVWTLIRPWIPMVTWVWRLQIPCTKSSSKTNIFYPLDETKSG